MDNIAVHLNTPCKGCGQPGATDNGFCLPCLETLQGAGGPPQPLMTPVSTEPPAARPRTTLDVILAGLIARSEDDHAERNYRLSHGMFIGIESKPGEILTLKIWRYHEPPSALEWTTTVAHLPEMYRPIKRVLPLDYEQGRLRGLTASWPIAARLF